MNSSMNPAGWSRAMWLAARHLLVWASLASVSGCAGFLVEPAWKARELNRSWAVVTSPHRGELASGVVLELPDAPYRLWFSDGEGQYFKPSLPLTIRTSDGLVMSREGGLYIKRSEPGRGMIWLLPLVGQPTLLTSPHWQVDVRQYTLGP